MTMTDQNELEAANAAYYAAFASRDVAAMSRLWADNDISCIHPGWRALVGRRDVVESYRLILSNPNQARVDHRDVISFLHGDEGRVLCVESVAGGALAATNLFRRVAGFWRLVHHQASPIAEQVARIERPPSSRLN